MRESSLNFNKNYSQQPKQIRGGEKKVMKKSLSLILAFAMVFSMFATSAFAAEASLDAQAKFDALKKAGIFEGLEDGSAGLDKEMTRAEFAAVLTRLVKLEKKTTNASYTDTATHWGHAQGYIEAVTAAKLMEGPAAGKFDPDGKVTTEQLATIMVRALKLEVDAKATVEGKVSDWAKGYVAAAIKASLIPNGKDFTTNAKRDALVSTTYVAKDKVVAPNPTGVATGISELKATGGSKLTVKLDGAADTTKAKFAVTRDGESVTVKEVKWADSKASADLILDGKLLDAAYEVTLSGIEKPDTAKAKATVNAEAEKVTKIDFVTASETIPQADNVRIEFKVVNQYGEDAKIPASDLDIDVTGIEDGDDSDVPGLSAIELDLANEDDYDRNDRINVQITDDENKVSASKVFTIGDEQYISKVEIGKLMDKTGKEITSVEEGDDDIYLQVFAYDQYGVRVLDEEVLKDDIDLSGASDIDVYTDEAQRFLDVDSDEYPDLRLEVEAEADDGEQTITIFASSSSESKKIKIATDSKPATVKFNVSSLTLSTLDGRVDNNGDLIYSSDSSSVLYHRYVPITVVNEAGQELSKEEIAEAAADGLLEVDSSGAVDNAEIVESGAFQGQVLVTGEDDAGNGTVEITIDNKPEVKATLKVKVGDAREIETIRLLENNGDKGINIQKDALVAWAAGELAETEFKFAAFDQYGTMAIEDGYVKDRDDKNIDYVVQLTFTGDGPATVELADGQQLFENFNTSTGLTSTPVAASSTWTVGKVVYGHFDDISDKEIVLSAEAVGVYKIKAEILKKDEDDTAYVEVDEVIKTYEVLETTNETYTWTAGLEDGVQVKDVWQIPNLNKLALTSGSLTMDATRQQLAKEVKVTAKDGSEELLVPDVVTSVTVPNVQYGITGNTGDIHVIAAKDDKETTMTVNFKTNKGTQAASLKVKGSNGAFNISEFKGGKTVRIIDGDDLGAAGYTHIWNNNLFDEVTAVELTYGNEYSELELGNTYLGLSYIIVEQEHADDVLEINADGSINLGTLDLNHTSGSFTIKLTAPSGAEKLMELGYENNTP